MVISALTMSCPASLAGEAQGWKRKAKTLPISWQSCHARGHSLCPSGSSCQEGRAGGEEENLGCVGTKHLYLVLREHLWKQNECQHARLRDRVVSVWLGSSALEGHSTMPFLHLPDSVSTCPNFRSRKTQEMRFFGPSWLPLY